ncbi:hypothetical protein HFO89_10940 [Rhizobium leguminosarum]|uniref:hypothetical protein n=1 Tax=Rhizobium leguminosarum TaxID=384 RepID=UPI001C96F9CB|nr:hypothetical protein [Rhizobium leguminosarum]MBY5456875.1 hypothetical protein [Rhizobium leguminosarum]
MALSFSGIWSYRSLVNNPDLSASFDSLRFGAGTLTLSEPAPGKIGGALGGTGWSLSLEGAATDGGPTTLKWQGRGIIENEEWVYDYLGYPVPRWPNGVDQVDTIVGTVIRTVTHSNGQSPAGYTATFYAVRV